MAKKRFLRVLPNPWTNIDENGTPNGFVLWDPAIVPPRERKMIGATISKADLVVPEVSETVRGMKYTLRQARHQNEITYETEPVLIEDTSYHRAEISQGNLIAADAETAAQCGIVDSFEEPLEHIAKLRELAIEQFKLANLDPPDVVEAKTATPPAPVEAPSSLG